MLIIKLLLEVIFIILVARMVIGFVVSRLPKKAPPEERYSPERFTINEKDIVDGEFKEIDPTGKK